jgi:PDZ domain-containing protein
VVKRAGKTVTEKVTLGAVPTTTGQKQQAGGYLGVEPDNTCLAPFTVDLGLGNQIGGPSAGMMFALGIMDKIGPTDLTNGRFIAGTGTITAAGAVGPIGGIALKMIAAKDKGASVFLAPAGNCSDVVKATPSGLDVVKVSTLHQAVQDLEKIEKGQAVPHC